MEQVEQCASAPALFQDITASSSSIITWQADSRSKELAIYVSKSNSPAAKEETEFTFVMGKNAKAIHEGALTVPFGQAVEMEISIYSGGAWEIQAWTIRAVLCSNPVIPGQYADPDIHVFGDKYYLYMTTDGFPGWSGTQFHVFSSSNLVDWADEGIILDVASSDVPWAIGSAWAPAAAEKNGKYYFYFCAKEANGISSIGVAVADSPTGPFTAMPNPLITMEMCRRQNISMGQTIDPSVFTEEDGTSYLLFGNGSPAIVRLGEDMASVDLTTLQNYSGAVDFREAITVAKRKGVYHFTWSCDDTGSDNYHVNYGTSDNLFGPIQFQYPILEKQPECDILGTGHHSILQILGRDEYYIAYHRFFTPLGIYASGLGYHRETCIDILTFHEASGLMNPAIPTLQGPAPRALAAGNAEVRPKNEK